MDEFPGLLAKDFGFRPQGKAAPMAASKGSSGGGGGMSFGIGSDSDAPRSSSSNRGKSSSSWSSTPIGVGVGGNSFLDDQDGIFGSSLNQKPKDHSGYGDVFGGPPKYSGGGGGGSFDYDSIFHKDSSGGVKGSNAPVFDKPVYDDDIFDGVPGLKPTSKYEDVFSSISSPPKKSSNYDDLLGDFGGKQEPEVKSTSTGRKRSGEVDKNVSDFDDLLPGFSGSSPPKNRTSSDTRGPHRSTVPTPKTAPSVVEDPFVVLESDSAPSHASSGLFSEPLEQTDKPSRSGRTKSDTSSPGGLFDDMDPLGFSKSVPFSSEANDREGSHSKNGRNTSYTQNSVGEESSERSFAETAESVSRKKAPVEDYHESHETLFDMPTVSIDSHKAFARNGSRPYANASPTETHSQVISPKSEDNLEAADDVWLTVSEIPLFTQPTSAPPPSRPPPRPAQSSKTVKGSFSAINSKKANEFPSFSSFSQNSRRPETIPDSAKNSGISSMEELEDFAMGRRQSNDERVETLSSEEDVETNSAAATAAMKEAMDRAEAKFKHAREVRERENAKVVRNGGVQQDRDEKATQDAEEREHREKQERLDRERREREDKEREQKRLEKERERAREIEREKARQAVERATKEARERAATEARQRAERAAFERAKSEARERAERIAVQRAHAEARERAAAEARERAERAAAEAKERANSDAREKAAAAARAESEARRRAERAAADRAAAEARERAAAEAREKATAAARGNQNKSNENDLESFFGMGNRPSSAPKSRTPPTDSSSHPQFHSRTGPEGAQWSSTGTSSTMRKASSVTNIVDDLTSIFGGTTQSSGGEFQDIEGETEERRRARLERHQRTQERAKKALAEKNERDLHNQREQAERHRFAETLDAEIKRWAAGKEGNLRALLSTLQYVLWPECGWQPVSLTDLITSASVKKVYRKATLCIHPDKVQQKGANLQQKYIAEKVFDLLKEAWNKFNSEELF